MKLATNNKHVLAEFETCSEQIGEAFGRFGGPWIWRLVQDEDAPYDSDEPTILESGAITMLFLGTGTTVAVDWTHREVLGFAAPDVTPDKLLRLIIGIAIEREQIRPGQTAWRSFLKRSLV